MLKLGLQCSQVAEVWESIQGNTYLPLYLGAYSDIGQFIYSGAYDNIYLCGLRFTLLACVGFDRNDINLYATHALITAGTIVSCTSWHARCCRVDGTFLPVLIDGFRCREYFEDDVCFHAVVRTLMPSAFMCCLHVHSMVG